MAVLNKRIQQRRATNTVWNNTDPILLNGEIGYNTTNKTIKIGDGVKRYTQLPTFILDAPSDDKIYVRKNGQWVDESALEAKITTMIQNLNLTDIVNNSIDAKLVDFSIFGLAYELEYNNVGKPIKINYSDGVTADIHWDGNKVTWIVSSNGKYIECKYNSGDTFIGRQVYDSKPDHYPYTDPSNNGSEGGN